jgi:hypothetical protein
MKHDDVIYHGGSLQSHLEWLEDLALIKRAHAEKEEVSWDVLKAELNTPDKED